MPEKPDCLQEVHPTAQYVKAKWTSCAYAVWSKIDLADVYFNIRAEESSETWTTILTTHGKMRSTVMLQGDCNAHGTMMEVILEIFKNVVYQYIVIYSNDIIIYGRTYEKHIKTWRKYYNDWENKSFI